MNRKRLEKLADFLETDVPKAKFSLCMWMEDSAHISGSQCSSKLLKAARKTRNPKKDAFKVGKKLSQDYKRLEPVTCQTVGCAVGWATTIPSFKRAGLYLVNNPWYRPEEEFQVAEIFYDGHTGFEAIENFFDLTGWEAGILFDPGDYPDSDHENPKAVAKRIRQLLAGKLVEPGWEPEPEYGDDPDL